MIIKSLKINRLKEGGSEKFSFVASTDSADRYNDIVEQNWSLDAYKRNPIVLFNHNQQALPIGRGDVRVENNQLMIDVEFDMEDATAAEIARKTKSGFLNAVSVGFQPLEFVPRNELPAEHKYAGKTGNLYTKSELLEVSIVTVPAQGDATAAKLFDFGDFTDVLKSKSAFYIKKNILNSIKKHIIYVEEDDDKYIVHFAKAEAAPEEEAEEEAGEEAEEVEEVEENFLDEFIKASDGEGYEDDEEKEEEEERNKNFNSALLRALTQMERVEND